MRRWFTFLDGAAEFDKIWHTVLLGLVVSFYVEGKEPSSGEII